MVKCEDPQLVEAVSNRSKCQCCGDLIAYRSIRVGMPARHNGISITKWLHPDCFARHGLRVDYAPTDRAHCSGDGSSIGKGEPRLVMFLETCDMVVHQKLYKPLNAAEFLQVLFALPGVNVRPDTIAGFDALETPAHRAWVASALAGRALGPAPISSSQHAVGSRGKRARGAIATAGGGSLGCDDGSSSDSSDSSKSDGEAVPMERPASSATVHPPASAIGGGAPTPHPSANRRDDSVQRASGSGLASSSLGGRGGAAFGFAAAGGARDCSRCLELEHFCTCGQRSRPAQTAAAETAAAQTAAAEMAAAMKAAAQTAAAQRGGDAPTSSQALSGASSSSAASGGKGHQLPPAVRKRKAVHGDAEARAKKRKDADEDADALQELRAALASRSDSRSASHSAASEERKERKKRKKRKKHKEHKKRKEHKEHAPLLAPMPSGADSHQCVPSKEASQRRDCTYCHELLHRCSCPFRHHPNSASFEGTLHAQSGAMGRYRPPCASHEAERAAKQSKQRRKELRRRKKARAREAGVSLAVASDRGGGGPFSLAGAANSNETRPPPPLPSASVPPASRVDSKKRVAPFVGLAKRPPPPATAPSPPVPRIDNWRSSSTAPPAGPRASAKHAKNDAHEDANALAELRVLLASRLAARRRE